MANKSGWHKKYYATAPGRYKHYQARAKKIGVNFDLTKTEVWALCNSPCRYCGLDTLNGVDRYNNAVGYTLGNCVPCCVICNDMKKAHSEDFFITHIRKVGRHTAELEVDETATPTEWRNLQRETQEIDDEQLTLGLEE